MHDVIIIGGGPCGISAAIECKKIGLNPLILDKGHLVNSIYHYPTSMTFFSSADKIELGGVPLIAANERPTREEALKYYRTLTRKFDLDIHTNELVTELRKWDNGFQVYTENIDGKQVYGTKHVIIATGYYDTPNTLNIPGEDLPHVHHYFRDAHPYAFEEVVVIGGRNSAVDTALDLQLAGANVTMVYRKGEIHPSVKSWIKPLIEGAIKAERIKMEWNSQVVKITKKSVIIKQNGQTKEIPARAVFAMTGYRPDLSLIEGVGAKINREKNAVLYNQSMETTVPGLYLAGVVASGLDATKIFIENGRLHGEIIAKHIVENSNKPNVKS